MDGVLMGTKELLKGTPLASKPEVSNTAKTSCSYSLNLVEVNCHAGNHTPDQYSQCPLAADEKPYYVLEIIETCPKLGPAPLSLPDMGLYGGGGNGGGGSSLTLSNEDSLNYMLNLIGMPALSPERYSYVASHPQIGKMLKKWYYQQINIERAKFLYWSIDFFKQNPNSSNHFLKYPEDLNKIKFQGLDYTNSQDVIFANKFASAFTEMLIAEKNNTVSQINIQNLAWKGAKEYIIYLIKQNAASAVKYGRVIYKHASEYFSQHPNSLAKVNEFLAYLKAGVEYEIPIQYNPKYMKWTDILLCWLFELGDFPVNDTTGYTLPTIGFSGSDYTISGSPSPNIIPMRYLSAHKIKNGIPDVNSVLDVRKIAIDQIKIGIYTPVNREWIFGSDATVETITKLDGMQFCLGSYITNVYITALGNNQYKLTYIIKNKTGWQSGTRGLNDYNGNPLDDSIIPDKPRGSGIHLGGTIGETFGWYEIVTVN